MKEKHEIIQRELRKRYEEIGSPKIVIGLSGGVDSAVVAAMIVDTLGRDKLIAVNIPSEYNSEKTYLYNISVWVN
jgi:NH3-dependent NAD+ synthetase